MESRTQFTFYASFYRSAKLIKNKSARADLYDAICSYALDGVEPDLSKLPESAAVAFVNAKPNLEASRRKAKNGAKGGKQTGSKLQTSTSKQEASGIKPGNSVSEKEKEKEIEIEYECTPPTPSVPSAEAHTSQALVPCECDIAQIIDMFHRECPSLPHVHLLSETTSFLIQERWKKHPDMNTFHTLFRATESSDFLTGKTGVWRADLDWLMQEKNFTRVINGSFSSTTSQKKTVPKGASGELGEAELEAIQRVLREE